MELKPLPIDGAFEIVPVPHFDERGSFARIYDADWFCDHGLTNEWVQESLSWTRTCGTVRGLHYQTPPFAETKLIRAVCGIVFDVIVDLRRSSATFGRWYSVQLSAAQMNQVYVPMGCAHGFCTLTDDVQLLYKMDEIYSPDHAAGLRWDDPEVGIKWPMDSPRLSEKDAAMPKWSEFSSPF
ncbi:MAG: dTDP-4-dehydrorhamnose 3,5-epimerase [Verrucomicrobiales bacterium]|nr:dTDP-4-dehydrorhamnose 3,5-epimerase [Verrucomicrobiales bacterium]MBL68883.1 dTDP-4-dehydrorhamnose 3,5-epimerase [Verrucomicrobiales bacterium]